MTLTETAAAYVAKKRIHPVPVCSAKRFASIMGDIEPASITQDTIETFVLSAREIPMNEWTLKDTVKDVITLVTWCGGPKLKNPVRKPQPNPEPCDIADIDAMWPWLAPWSEQLVVLSYWTAARLNDVIALQLRVSADWRIISWEADKTERLHKVPVPTWLRQWLKPVKLPYSKANDHAQVVVRGELERVSAIAGIPRIMPSNIRDRALTEWSKINCGSIMHGCGIGDTRDHYVPPLEILEANCGRLRVPQAFGAAVGQEDLLLSNFRRLDPSAQSLITGTAERLAAG